MLANQNTSDNHEKNLHYWQEQLADISEEVILPLTRLSTNSNDIHYALYSFHLKDKSAQHLKLLANHSENDIGTILLSGFQILLYRYFQQENFVIGILNEASQIIPLQLNCNASQNFDILLNKLRQSLSQAYQHQNIHFSDLSKILSLNNVNISSILQISYRFYQQNGESLPNNNTKLIDNINLQKDCSPLLILSVEQCSTDFSLSFQYATGVFEQATIERMASHFDQLIQGMLSQPTLSIDQLPLLTEQEKQHILLEWNRTSTNYPADQTIAQLFQEQAQKTPNNIAVAFENQEITYQELNERANQLAYYLKSAGVAPEAIVAVSLEKSLDLVVALLAIIKAGGAYVPLDSSYPADRLQYMLDNTQATVLITQSDCSQQFNDHQRKIILLDKEWPNIIKQAQTEGINAQTNPESLAKPDNLAYVIYTSGSTGKPKGVMVEQRSIVRLVKDTNYINLDSKNCIAQASNVSFDAATFEIWGALLNGAKLVLLSKQTVISPDLLAESIAHYKIDTLFLTKALFDVVALSKPEAFYGIETLLTGGEALSVSIIKKMLENHKKPKRLLNVYGPTETTTFATAYLIESTPKNNTIPIGHPISNTTAYILDKQLQPVPVEVIGELYIGGPGVARGYLNLPEQTQAQFIDNPFATENEKQNGAARLYRTGDLVRYLPDGNIEHISRIDNQIKLRGFRVELGEIDQALRQHEMLKDVAVVAREDNPGQKYLAAYVTAKQPLDDEKTATWLEQLKVLASKQLPEYMVPNHFILLDKLPLNQNGKLDKKALPSPLAGRNQTKNLVKPSTPVEQKLADISYELLNIDNIGLDENLISLGMNSLIVGQLCAYIRDTFKVAINARDIFEHPTLHGLAQWIQAQSKNDEFSIVKYQQYHKPIPLTAQQEQIWFIIQISPNNLAYNTQCLISFKGKIDKSILEKCLTNIIQRHEILRTTFPNTEQGPVQLIHEPWTVVIDDNNLSAYDSETQAKLLQASITAEVAKPFDLSTLPLARWHLYQLSEEESVLLQVEHHFVHDGWSTSLLLREIEELYEAYSQGITPNITASPIQYKDYALWQQEWRSSQKHKEQLNYWINKLKNCPEIIQLPTDKPRPLVENFKGGLIKMTLDKELEQQVRQFCKTHLLTPFTVMYAAFALLLFRYSNQEDILVGTTSANRQSKEVEKLIGMFVNTLVIRTDLSGKPSVLEFLSRIKNTLLELFENQNITFRDILKELPITRVKGANPLFQIMFSSHDSCSKPKFNFAGIKNEWRYVHNQSAKVDLNVICIPWDKASTGKDSELIWEYNADIFNKETVLKMTKHYSQLLATMIEHPLAQIKLLDFISADEKDHLLKLSLPEPPNYISNKTIQQLFEEHVERIPDNIAVVFEDQQLTYRELNEKANQLAHYLKSLGIGPEILVAISVEKSIELIIGTLAVIKTGGAYVPLDPGYPPDRLQYMLENAQAPVLLTHSDFIKQFSIYQQKIIQLDKDWPEIIAHEQALGINGKVNPKPLAKPDNLSYVIYTSGSTGKPKGVMLEERNTVRLVKDTNYINLNEQSCIAQASNISFDVAAFEIWGALLNGAKLVIFSKQTVVSPDLLAKNIARYKVDTIFITKTLFDLVALTNPHAFAGVETLFVGGEALSAATILKVLGSPQRPKRILNGYGPTEAATYATTYQIEKYNIPNNIIPIGRPISNTTVYILDPSLQFVPQGVIGELYIGGIGVARGYLNRPDITKERFLENPFASSADKENGATRLYKTGDLVRYLPDGNIEYLGRIDNQVKLRGFRIELGEIEEALRQQDMVKDVAVIVREDQPNLKRLAAYLIAHQSIQNGEDVTKLIEQIRYGLSKQLPEYMIPSSYIFLEKFPFNANGKLDHRALPAPAEQHITESTEQPKTALEQTLKKLWQEILGIKQIGLHDNFFTLGGYSLLLIQLAQMLKKELSIDISIGNLYRLPTISLLANYIEAGDFTASASQSVIPIQTKGSKPPLFLFPDVSGLSLFYRKLKEFLPDQPIYGFNHPYFGKEGNVNSLKDLAAEYVSLLRNIQPQGLYYLGGLSLGGEIALEVAEQLKALGQSVALIILIDSYNHSVSKRRADAIDDNFIVKYLESAKHNGLANISKELLQKEFSRNLSMLAEHHPSSYDGKVLLIKAKGEATVNVDKLSNKELSNGWSGLLPNLKVRIVEGNHFNLFTDDRICHIGKLIQEEIKAADCSMTASNMHLITSINELGFLVNNTSKSTSLTAGDVNEEILSKEEMDEHLVARLTN